MSDGRALAREFLEQQRLLGGDAVILSEGSGDGTRDTGNLRSGPAATPPASRLPASDLPPPGISYDPPGGDLFSSDPVPQAVSLEAIAQLVASCTKCRLCEGRRRTVPGEGAAEARLVVVGEGPGRVEDDGPMARLFLGAGRKAGIRPGDLVGAITGEAGLTSRSVGAIEIADNNLTLPSNRTPAVA